jgi:hypothetical protein
MKRALGTAVALAVAVAARGARADEPTVAPGMAATSTQLQLAPFGEPTSDRWLAPAIAVLPLRLSLVGATFPAAPLFGDACSPQLTDPTGNTTWGFPLQRQVYMPITSQLVLHGFMRGGCAVDAGAGGGVTYSIPLPKDMWLVASAGAYTQPNLPTRAPMRADARVDLILRSTPSSALSVGLGRRGIALSGLW